MNTYAGGQVCRYARVHAHDHFASSPPLPCHSSGHMPRLAIARGAMQRRRAGGRRTSLALSLVAATAWRAAATGPEWGALCRGEDQSPIDIEPFNVEPSDLQA